MTLRDLSNELVRTNAIVLRTRKNDLTESLVEQTFNNLKEFHKWFLKLYTKIADVEIVYISIDTKGTLIIRI